MLEQKVDIFIMAGKRKQLSNDIKNVIVEMRKSGHKLQEIADTLNIPRGTVSDVVVRFKRRGSVENKPHTGRHRLLDERDTRGLVRLVRSDRKTRLKDVPTRFNDNRETQVSKRTVPALKTNNYIRNRSSRNIQGICNLL
jgi:transposase